MGLPDDINPIKFSIGSTGGPGSQIVITPKPNLPMAAQPDQDNEVIVIEDEDRGRRKRSHSPWEKDQSPKSRVPKKKSDTSPVRRGRSRNRSVEKRIVDRRSAERRSMDRRSVDRRSSSKAISSKLSPRSHSMERSRDYRKSRSPSLRESSRDHYLRREEPRRDEHRERRDEHRERREEHRERRDEPRERRDEHKERSFSTDRLSPSIERMRERRDYERKRIDYRESSFERDLRAKERIRTVADLPWEREKRKKFEYFKQIPFFKFVRTRVKI